MVNSRGEAVTNEVFQELLRQKVMAEEMEEQTALGRSNGELFG
jgi:hypothetical protein